MAMAVSITDPYILSLGAVTEDPDLAFYAIYSKAPSAHSEPNKVIILNLAYLPANSTFHFKPEKYINVSGILGQRVKVTRLSGPGSDSILGATLAGQSFDSGKPSGKKMVEMVTGTVKLRSSEAVILKRY
jgi:hypothetical protein